MKTSGKDSARYLAAFLLTAALLYGLGVVAAHYAFTRVAPQFTGNRAFNQKLMFLRDHGRAGAPFGYLIGSSMGLSNINTDQLEEAEGKAWINSGIWGLSLSETRGIYDVMRQSFPAREVVLATQYFEMSDKDRVTMKIDPATFKRYVGGNFGWVEDFAYRDLLESVRQRQSWPRDEGNPKSAKSLVFTRTGAVPIDLYDGPQGPDRYSQFEEYLGCTACTRTLDQICRAVRQDGMAFTLVIPPLTHASREKKPNVRRWYAEGRRRMRQVVTQCGGRVFDAAEQGEFDDSCFVDFAHLNRQGTQAFTNWFIAWRQGKPAARERVICQASGTPQRVPLP